MSPDRLPEDMFAETETPAPVSPSLISQVTPPSPRPSISSEPALPVPVSPEHHHSTGRLVLMGITGVLLLITAGFAIWRWQAADLGASSTSTTNQSAGSVIVQNLNQASSVTPSTTNPDQDRDGLSDIEEAILGTDAGVADTDQDGLIDREEVKAYGSNPKLRDTDGDGYTDGDEVKSGYSPIGSGKLFDLQKTLINGTN